MRYKKWAQMKIRSRGEADAHNSPSISWQDALRAPSKPCLIATFLLRFQITTKQLKLRDQLWPGLDEARLWTRLKKDGFTTIPRTMPLILQIMD